MAQTNTVTLPLVAKSSTVNDTHPSWLFAPHVWKKGGKKLPQTNWKIEAVDLGRPDFLGVTTINHRNFPGFTFDLSPPLLFLSVAQDMTQSWPSQQVLGGDPAQRMLYNTKACQCVECVSLASILANHFWKCKTDQTYRPVCKMLQQVWDKKVKMRRCRWPRKMLWMIN